MFVLLRFGGIGRGAWWDAKSFTGGRDACGCRLRVPLRPQVAISTRTMDRRFEKGALVSVCNARPWGQLSMEIDAKRVGPGGPGPGPGRRRYDVRGAVSVWGEAYWST